MIRRSGMDNGSVRLMRHQQVNKSPQTPGTCLTDTKPLAHPSTLFSVEGLIQLTAGLESNEAILITCREKYFSQELITLCQCLIRDGRFVLRSLVGNFTAQPCVIFMFHKHTSIT